MKLHNISINSLRRRKTKMLFLVLGLMIGVGTVVTLVMVSRTMNDDIAKKMDEYGANILIVPKSDDLALSYGGMSVSGVSYDMQQLHTEDVAIIHSIKNKDNIAIVAPKLINTAKIHQKDVLVVGIDFQQELRLKKWWSLVGTKPHASNESLLGAEAKQKLGLTLNQEFTIEGKSFKVTGILESTGSQDDGVVMIDLKEAQALFKKPSQLSMIEVAALCYDCPIEEIVRQTSEKLPSAKVTAIRQAIESKMDAMHRFQHFSFGISIVVLIIGALIVFTTMMASVNERTREIGVFRAIGFRQSHVMKIILIEACITSSLGGLLGYMTGYGISRLVAPLLTMNDGLSVSFDYRLMALSVVLGVVVGMVASVYPAYKASRLEPTIALRAL